MNFLECVNECGMLDKTTASSCIKKHGLLEVSSVPETAENCKPKLVLASEESFEASSTLSSLPASSKYEVALLFYLIAPAELQTSACNHR